MAAKKSNQKAHPTAKIALLSERKPLRTTKFLTALISSIAILAIFSYFLYPHLLPVFTTIWPKITGARTIIRVSPEGDDANNGSSWNRSKRTIQAALDTAGENSDVWIKEGTYRESININKNRLRLIGGFSGDENNQQDRIQAHYSTLEIANQPLEIIQGDQLKIEGIALKNGRSGQLKISQSTNITIGQSKFDNTSDDNDSSCLTIEKSTVTINQTYFNGCQTSGSGGAITAVDSDLTLNSTRLFKNTAASGAAINLTNGNLNLNNVIVDHNIAGQSSALNFSGQSIVKIKQSDLVNNRALNGNSVISVNDTASVKVLNSIIAYNHGGQAAIGKGAEANLEVIRSDFWTNDNGNFSQGIAIETTNIEQLPNFINGSLADDPLVYQLDSASQLIDQGDSVVSNDFYNNNRPVKVKTDRQTESDLGAFEYQGIQQRVTLTNFGDQSTAKLHAVIRNNSDHKIIYDDQIPMSVNGYWTIRSGFTKGSGPYDVYLSANGYQTGHLFVSALPADNSVGSDITLEKGNSGDGGYGIIGSQKAPSNFLRDNIWWLGAVIFLVLAILARVFRNRWTRMKKRI